LQKQWRRGIVKNRLANVQMNLWRCVVKKQIVRGFFIAKITTRNPLHNTKCSVKMGKLESRRDAMILRVNVPSRVRHKFFDNLDVRKFFKD